MIFAISRSRPWSAGIGPGEDVGALLPRLSTYLGHLTPGYTYWYLSAAPELLALAAGRLAGEGEGRGKMSALAPAMQLFFTERLARQGQANPATVISYRNTFRLLLRFLQEGTGKAPSALDWDDLGAEVISAFLDHLEADRHNIPRRNARLAALRSLFQYAAVRHPEHAQFIQQVLAIRKALRQAVTFPGTQRSRRPAGSPGLDPVGGPA